MSAVSRQMYRLIHSPRAARMWLLAVLVVFVAFAVIVTWSMSVHVLSGCTADDAHCHGGIALQLLAGLGATLVLGAAVTRFMAWHRPEWRVVSYETAQAGGIARTRTRRPALRRAVWRLPRSASSDDDPVPASRIISLCILTVLTPRLRHFARCGGSSHAPPRHRSASGRLPMLPPGRAPVALPSRP